MLGFFAFLIGASVGSFLTLAADRLPSGRSIVSPGSYCEACEHPLGHLDMVPILSYLWLKGKCHHCSAHIPVRLMAVEALMGALFTVIYLKSGLDVGGVLLAAGVSLLVLVALIDIDRGLILNKLMFPSIIALLVLAPFWTELGLSRSFLGSDGLLGTSLNSILSGLGAFLLFLIIAMIYPQGMGGGDIKLSGVIGLLVGFPGSLIALWLAAVSGGVASIGLIAMRKMGRKDTMPFGPFLALGAIAALLAGSEITSWYHSIGDFLVGT